MGLILTFHALFAVINQINLLTPVYYFSLSIFCASFLHQLPINNLDWPIYVPWNIYFPQMKHIKISQRTMHQMYQIHLLLFISRSPIWTHHNDWLVHVTVNDNYFGKTFIIDNGVVTIAVVILHDPLNSRLHPRTFT